MQEGSARGAARRDCRCSACPSRSRTTSTSPACRPPPPARPSPTRRGAAPPRCSGCSPPARCWLGKTNLDQFATGLVGTRSPYGAAAQRLRRRRASAAGRARARRSPWRAAWCRFALGTDTAGSGRVPAGFNGIVGLKPTPGRVSTAGVVPACRSLDCVSVFALTSPTPRACWRVIEGADAADAYSALRARRRPRSPARAAHRRAGARRPSSATPATRRRSTRASAQLRALGQQLVPSSTSRRCSRWPRCSTRARGWPSATPRCGALLARSPRRFDPTVRRGHRAARAASAPPTPSRAQYRLRDAAARSCGRCGSEVDVLLVPTAPGHPTLDEVDADPIGANARLGTYTNFVNLLGWCALALPAGFTRRRPALRRDLHRARRRRRGAGALGRAGRPARDCRWARRRAACAADRRRPLPAGEPTLPIAVVGAHLSGLPLNGQLLERGARLRERRAPRRTTACTRCPARAAQARPAARGADGGARDRGRGLGHAAGARSARFLR